MGRVSFEKLSEIASGFVQAKILLTGAQLHVFDHVVNGATAEEVRARIEGDLRGVEILLDALTAMEIVDKHESTYRLRAEYVPWLTDDSPSEFAALLRHRNHMFQNWARLEDRVAGRGSGPPAGERAVLEDAEKNDSFIRAMYAFGRDTAATVAERLDLTGVRTLADLAGGPGHYLAEFARRSEHLEPWLIDLPLTLKVARRLLAGSPLRERIRMAVWDVYADDPPADLPVFDLIFVSQLLHAESSERNRVLFRRLFPLVAEGGRVVVNECVVSPDRTAPIEATLFAVNMLAMTPEGRTYTEEEIHAWAREAGFAPEASDRIDERTVLLHLRRPAR
jgi:hypothetical protein